jgi:hypothetical protein
MKILSNNKDLSILINTEQNFKTDLGAQENLLDFEDEVLKDIINPAQNYETVRYIHEPYIGKAGLQTDIWFEFYFISGSSYVQDYTPIGISTRENELMLKQSTESFFRLEFFKTPQIIWNEKTTYNLNDYVNFENKKYRCASVSGSTGTPPPSNSSSSEWTLISNNYELVCEPPNRQNRRLVFSKNLSLPLGEKYFLTGTNFGYYIHLPIFTGSNYRNKENMYLFWFEDESVLEETNLSGSTTGNTFFMTAKFFNAKEGSVIDFTSSGLTSTQEIKENRDMYYQVDFDNINRTYKIFRYNNVKDIRVGNGYDYSIKYYEKGGGTVLVPIITPTPTPSSPCYCYDIVVTGTTGSEGGGGGQIEYNNCFGELIGSIYTRGPAVYKLCIQRIGGVVQYDPSRTYGIDQSYLIGVGNGNCNNGFPCGTNTTPIPIPISPTPTPLPTATQLPTATPVPTALPTYANYLYYIKMGKCYGDGTIYWSIGYVATNIVTNDFVIDESGNGNVYTVIEVQYVSTNPSTNGNIQVIKSRLTICPTPLPTATPTVTPLPTATPTGPTPTPTVTPTGPTPTPLPTSPPGSFEGTVVFGDYPVTSPGFATLTIQNTTSTDKYIWLRSNSGSANSGTLSGQASITTAGYENTITVSNTITLYGQLFDGGSSLYLPVGATYTFNVVHTSPSAGSFYLTYTDINTPNKMTLPLTS